MINSCPMQFYIFLILVLSISSTFSAKATSSCESVSLSMSNRHKKKILTYAQAETAIQKIGVNSSIEYRKLHKARKLPDGMPSAPDESYRNKGWESWGKFLGTYRVATYKKEFLSYDQAQKIFQKIGVTSAIEYRKLHEARKLPDGMPSAPDKTYKNKGWESWGKFLGTYKTANQKKEFLSYDQAQKIVQKIGVTSAKEYKKLHKAGKLPDGMPSNPNRNYKDKGWESWGKFLGTYRVANQKKEFFSYDQAQKIFQKIGVTSSKEYRKLYSAGKFPDGMPSKPYGTYKNKGWESWGKFLGTYRVASQKKEFFSYDQAQEIVQKIGVTSLIEYKKLHKARKFPDGMPSNPDKIYKDKGWESWGKFLGTYRVASQKKEFFSYDQAQKIVQKIGVTSLIEYRKLHKARNFPDGMPSHPQESYKNKGWKDWGKFLGTHRVASQKKEFFSYDQAQKIVQKIGVTSAKKYKELHKARKLPDGMPSHPQEIYRNKGWKGWRHFFGTVKMMTYRQAQNYVLNKLQISTPEELKNWSKSDQVPVNFPLEPYNFYPEWIDTRHFLKIEESSDIKSYQEFKELMLGFKLRSKKELFEEIRNLREEEPNLLPLNPKKSFKNEWEGWEIFIVTP